MLGVHGSIPQVATKELDDHVVAVTGFRHIGIVEEAMKQALLEKRVDFERVKQLMLKESNPGPNVGNSQALLEQVKVVLPDLSQYDKLKAPVLRPQDGQGEGEDGK